MRCTAARTAGPGASHSAPPQSGSSRQTRPRTASMRGEGWRRTGVVAADARRAPRSRRQHTAWLRRQAERAAPARLAQQLRARALLRRRPCGMVWRRWVHRTGLGVRVRRRAQARVDEYIAARHTVPCAGED
eukprot:scaffold3290_cov123-Isochrysis_galbana.AAC.2